MKRLITIIAIMFLMAAPGVAAEQTYMIQSAAQTADADALVTGEGYFHGVIIKTDGTNAVTVFAVYDSLTAAAGTKLLMPNVVVTTSATDRVQSFSFDPPVPFHTGLSVDITCAGTISYMTYHSFQ